MKSFKDMATETKVGLFALLCIVIIAYVTIKVSDRSVIVGGGYSMHVTMDSALGIRTKTPVEIAGIQVGVVRKIKLDDAGKAHVTLSISKGVRLPEGTRAFVRAKGFLGETFVELRPGPMENPNLPGDEAIPYGGIVGDMNLLMSQFNQIASDIKQVTGSLTEMVGSDSSSPVYRTVHNLDEFTETLKNITIRNEASLNQVIENMAVLTAELSSITGKVDSGKGTIGKLVNDETTVNNLNSALDGLNDALGGLRKLETQIGYHTEYLGGTHDFKQYVHLNLLPRPDEAFLFEFVSDPSSSPIRVERATSITAGGVTSNVQTKTATIEQNRFLFSAQLAKKFYDFTLRGGIIESTGGVGLDYNTGPMGLHLSAFDMATQYGQRPHLKAMANLNVTKSIFLVGGADDFINPSQPVDWFIGAGFRLVDEDVKSLIGLGAKAVR